MNLAFIVNDVATETAAYTTVQLAFRAQQLGHTVYLTGVGDLIYFPSGEMGARARTVTSEAASAEDYLAALQSDENEAVVITAADLDVLWIRNDPSVDIETRPWAQMAGVVFGKVAMELGVVVLNHPDTLFNCQNKMYFQHFPEVVRPRTLITRQVADVQRFYEEQNHRIVIKPLQGSGGKDVFLLKEKATNLQSIVDAVARNGYVIAQEYLPEAANGDVRLLVMNGRALQHEGKFVAVRRKNDDDFRSNISAGGQAVSVEVTDTMLRLVDQVRPKLLHDGVFMVGLDIVGDKLMEVNVFSPGGIYEAVEVEGVDFYEPVIAALERKVYYKKLYGDRISNRELAVMD
jgi:glutathione synthase